MIISPHYFNFKIQPSKSILSRWNFPERFTCPVYITLPQALRLGLDYIGPGLVGNKKNGSIEGTFRLVAQLPQ